MALNAAIDWEVRFDGDLNFGGGYNRDAGTTDYSQQDAAQLNVTDAATSGIGVTTLTSATGGFTAAMVGNVLKLFSGTNLTDGWYEITAYTDTNTVTLDRAPDDGVGGVSGANCNVGGALTFNDANIEDFAESIVAGNIVYVESGTHTLGASFDSSKDGTSTSWIQMIGYLEGGTRSISSYPTLNDRPLINCGVGTFAVDNYWKVRNLRTTGTSVTGLRADLNGIIVNCDAVNTSSTSNRHGIYGVGANARIDACSGKATKGNGIVLGGVCTAEGCLAYDSNKRGFYVASNTSNMVDCIADSCGIGVDISSKITSRLRNLTVRNCVTGFSGTTGYGAGVVNSIIADCYTGASWTTEYISWWDYNNWYGNNTDVSNVTKGPNAMALDPEFTDGISTGIDGTTEAGDETDFRSASATFQTDGVTTSDVLVIKAGTSVTTGVYAITAVVSETQLTIAAGASTGASGCTYGITHGEDLTPGTNMKAAAFPGAFRTISDAGATAAAVTSYLDVGAVQRVEPAGGGSTVPQGLHPVEAGIVA